MPSKHRSSIIKNQDVAAATFVVGSDLEVADFTSLADAILNLPSSGGKIALLEGAHPFTPSGVLPANLEIVGAGNLASEIVLGAALTFGLGNALKDIKVSGAFTVSLGVEFQAEGARFASAVIIPAGADRVTLIGNRFEFIGLRSIDIVAGSEDAIIQGNFFIGFTAEAIRTAGLSAIVDGNINCEVTEIVGADQNRYTDNTGFSTSTIIGLLSTVEGIRRFDSAPGDSTTAVFVDLFTFAQQKAVPAYGTIKNTGGVNAMEVRETATDAFGVTSSVTTTVAPGGVLTLVSAFVGLGGVVFTPFVSYTIAVRHPVAATTYEAHFAVEGAVP